MRNDFFFFFHSFFNNKLSDTSARVRPRFTVIILQIIYNFFTRSENRKKKTILRIYAKCYGIPERYDKQYRPGKQKSIMSLSGIFVEPTEVDRWTISSRCRTVRVASVAVNLTTLSQPTTAYPIKFNTKPASECGISFDSAETIFQRVFFLLF